MASREEQLEAEISEYKNYEIQLQAIEKQIALIDETRRITEDSIEALKVINDSSPGTEVLLPIGAGIEFPVTLQDNKRVIVDIGSGVAIEISPDKGAELLESKLKELEDTRERLAGKLKEISEKAAALGEKIEKDYVNYMSSMQGKK